MPYTQFVEIGRVALVVFGPQVDNLAAIVDIIDDKRVLIDLVKGADSRQVISVKRLKLTNFKVDIERGAAPAAVAAALGAADVAKKFAETKWGKKLAAGKARSELTDFQRFKYTQLVAQRATALVIPDKGGKGKGAPQGKQAKGGKK